MSKSIVGWIKANLKSEKGVRILVICGIIGMALIFLSGFLGGGKTEKPPIKAEESGEQYELDLENRMSGIIQSIAGSGRVQVLITVRGGARNVYVNEQKTETVVEEENSDGNVTKKKQTDQFENEYVRVKDADGGESALMTTQMQPEIQGVVVVCDGGEDTVVKQRITEAVTTVLDISSKYVCVTKMAE